MVPEEGVLLLADLDRVSTELYQLSQKIVVPERYHRKDSALHPRMNPESRTR